MMTRSRFFRHLFTTSAAGRSVFPPDALRAIEACISEGETCHDAEVRLIIEHSLPVSLVLKKVSPRQRAIELFSRYRIWDTERNSGILIYVNLADRKVEIIADRGVDRLVAAVEWQALCQTVTRGFAKGAFLESMLAALAQLNAMLRERLPSRGDHPNQLPDKPLVI